MNGDSSGMDRLFTTTASSLGVQYPDRAWTVVGHSVWRLNASMKSFS